jgi:hypothetical protein
MQESISISKKLAAVLSKFIIGLILLFVNVEQQPKNNDAQNVPCKSCLLVTFKIY